MSLKRAAAAVIAAAWMCMLVEAAVADPIGDAESAVREVLARDLSTVLTVKDKENDDRKFLTPDLYRLYNRSNDFDADPYTATQDNTGYRLDKMTSISTSASRVIVTALFSIDGSSGVHPKIVYDMMFNGAVWQIQDIAYPNDKTSLRKILGKLH